MSILCPQRASEEEQELLLHACGIDHSALLECIASTRNAKSSMFSISGICPLLIVIVTLLRMPSTCAFNYFPDILVPTCGDKVTAECL